MSQEILEPSEAEMKWIDAHIQVVQAAIATFAVEHGEKITVEILDVTFAAWLSQHDPQQEDPNPYINAFGIGFGQYLVDHLDFAWVVVRDENGTEIAVLGQPGNILLYPPNLVAKRYVSKTTGFFSQLYTQIEKEVVTRRGDTPRKFRWKFWSK